MATLPETLTANSSTGHIAHHAELRDAYVGRGGATTIPVLTLSSTVAEHQQVHALLHAEYNARTGGALPTSLSGTTGHISHHSTLHAAHNSLQVVTADVTGPIATTAPTFTAGSSYYPVDPARTTL